MNFKLIVLGKSVINKIISLVADECKSIVRNKVIRSCAVCPENIFHETLQLTAKLTPFESFHLFIFSRVFSDEILFYFTSRAQSML